MRRSRTTDSPIPNSTLENMLYAVFAFGILTLLAGSCLAIIGGTPAPQRRNSIQMASLAFGLAAILAGLLGYGAKPPTPAWPFWSCAVCAVALALLCQAWAEADQQGPQS